MGPPGGFGGALGPLDPGPAPGPSPRGPQEVLWPPALNQEPSKMHFERPGRVLVWFLNGFWEIFERIFSNFGSHGGDFLLVMVFVTC